MKVNQTGSNPVQSSETSAARKAERANQSQEAKAPAKKPATSAQAAVNSDISADAKDFAKAKEIATNAPDVREEKIAELKKRIAEGRYKVNTHAVADKIVDEHLKTGGA